MKPKTLVCLFVDGNVRFGVVIRQMLTNDLQGEREEVQIRLEDKEGKESVILLPEEAVKEVTGWGDSALADFARQSEDWERATQYKRTLEPAPKPEDVIEPPQPEAVAAPMPVIADKDQPF